MVETETVKDLFESYYLGDIKLKNRVGMAALTRCRAEPKTGIPNDMHVKYYSDRGEDAGFILT